MARAVLPKATASELWLLAGQVDRDDACNDGAPTLEEDSDLDCWDDDDDENFLGEMMAAMI